TPAIAEALTFATACDFIGSIGLERIEAHERDLVSQLRSELAGIQGVRVFGPDDALGIVSFELPGVHPHDLGTILDEENVAIRAGHHCCQPLMDHLGVPATARASFGVYSDQSDIEALMRGIERTLKIFA
ncbi:MAG: aminotransferase class V-fold PLP-dependent enzyme, partial [Citromicrobium sp.]|nr:aminotransferase class V-fold PLP-dependent enzyme [Citromicrobium sp.]